MEPTRVNIHQWYYIICIYIYWQLYIFFKTKINLFKSIWREKQVKVSRIRCIIIVEILNLLPSSYRLCKFCNAKMVSNGERNVVGIDPGPSRHRKVEHGDALWSCLHFSFFFFSLFFPPFLVLCSRNTPPHRPLDDSLVVLTRPEIQRKLHWFFSLTVFGFLDDFVIRLFCFNLNNE